MTHKRKTIRDAVVTLLDTGTIVASGRVYSNRAISVKPGDFPVINVSTLSETSQPIDFSTKQLQRVLTLQVEAVAKDTAEATIDDTLDTLAEGIESALRADSAWNGTVFDATLVATSQALDTDGEYPLGRVLMTYTARYIYPDV